MNQLGLGHLRLCREGPVGGRPRDPIHLVFDLLLPVGIRNMPSSLLQALVGSVSSRPMYVYPFLDSGLYPVGLSSWALWDRFFLQNIRYIP